MKTDLNPIYMRDVEDLYDALIDANGDVKSYLTVMVNGKERFINVGLIALFKDFIWGRPMVTSYDATVDDLCKVFFNNYTEYDEGDTKPKLISASFTKQGDTIHAAVVRQARIGERLLGKPFILHYVARHLTTYQQVMGMYLLLGHGQDGNPGQGMLDWSFYVYPSEEIVSFKLEQPDAG